MGPNPLGPRKVSAEDVWRPLAVTLMFACLGLAVTAAARAVAPEWPSQHVLYGIILAAIESIYSFRVLRLPRSHGTSIVRYRLAEWGLLAILLKILTYLDRPWPDTQRELLVMLRQPGAFFSADFAVMLIAAWLTWLVVDRIMVDFEALSDPERSGAEQQTPRENLTSRFYWGGGLLIFMIGLPHLMGNGTDSLPVHAILYFLLGTVMLSQMWLTSLSTGWRLQNVTVADGMAATWATYGAAFLTLMVLTALLLPTQYSMGLFETVVLGLNALLNVIRRMMELMIMLVTVPTSWLLRLLGFDNEAGHGLPPPPVLDAPTPAADDFRLELPGFQMIKAVLFWLTFLGVAIYLIRSYIADHPELLSTLQRFTLLRWAFGMLVHLIGLFSKWMRSGRGWRPIALWNRSRASEAALRPPGSRWRGSRPRPQTARAQVIDTYTTMLQHASAAGIHRQKHQTPYEYAPNLYHAVPDAGADVDDLTDVFVRARYHPAQVNHDDVEKATELGQRVQRALQESPNRDVDATCTDRDVNRDTT